MPFHCGALVWGLIFGVSETRLSKGAESGAGHFLSNFIRQEGGGQLIRCSSGNSIWHSPLLLAAFHILGNRFPVFEHNRLPDGLAFPASR